MIRPNSPPNLVIILVMLILGFFHKPSIAQCAPGGIISTSTSFQCMINSGTLSITNSGSIVSSENALLVPTFSNLDQVSNSGIISSMANDGILNDSGGVIGTLINSGQISSGGSWGINTSGTVTTLTNTTAGAIQNTGGGGAIYNSNQGNIGSLNNAGTISSTGGDVIVNDIGGAIRVLINSGQIASPGAGSALSNFGAITALTNTATGAIQNTGDGAAIINYSPGNIENLNNAGVISAASGNSIINDSGATMGSLTNSGLITAVGPNLVNLGTITNINNTFTGIFSSAGDGVLNYGLIGTLTNSGNITTSGNIANSIHNEGTISALINAASGVIEQSGFSPSIGNTSTGYIGNLFNSGIISSASANAIFNNGGKIEILTNFGQIISAGTVSAISNYGTITNLTNAAGGVIQNNGSSRAIYNNIGKTIGTLNNAGSISGGGGVEAITNFGTISTLINTGIIGKIVNSATISGLINQQGASSSALIYKGALPTNYNIIIKSPGNYGQLAVISPTGSTTFGIYAGGVSGSAASTVSKGIYANVIKGISSANLAGSTSGTYNGYIWTLNNSSETTWDLVVTASTADTQQSLVNTTSVLQGIYTLQNTVLANSFSYDCAVFGRNDVCVSAGGRNTAVQAEGINNTSGLLIAAYRPHPSFRFGAYADQNLSTNSPSGTVRLGNNTPLLGLFAAWSEQPDGTGAEVKVSAAYGKKNATVTRTVVGTSDPGTGSSSLTSQGFQVTGLYGFGVMEDATVSPYIGIRYTQNNMGGYTEAASASVTTPLSYSALNTNATTALAGVGASYRFIPEAAAFASAGVETDTNTNNGTYLVTGITGLTPLSFNANPVKTRPTTSLGAYYDMEKNGRIGITGIYRQEPYKAVSTTTVMATYAIGL
jgi:hypothetical protein